MNVYCPLLNTNTTNYLALMNWAPSCLCPSNEITTIQELLTRDNILWIKWCYILESTPEHCNLVLKASLVSLQKYWQWMADKNLLRLRIMLINRTQDWWVMGMLRDLVSIAVYFLLQKVDNLCCTSVVIARISVFCHISSSLTYKEAPGGWGGYGGG